jgi:hypothetical protein
MPDFSYCDVVRGVPQSCMMQGDTKGEVPALELAFGMWSKQTGRLDLFMSHEGEMLPKGMT